MNTTTACTNTVTDWRYVVAFWLDRHMYAVAIESVVKISEITALAPVVHTDASVVGVIEFAGRTVPVVDLQNPPDAGAAASRHAPALVVQIGEALIAIAVDKIAGVARLPAWQMCFPSVKLPGAIVYTPYGAALLLNLARLFTADQLQAMTGLTPALARPTAAMISKAQI